jgi:hypothetical protein
VYKFNESFFENSKKTDANSIEKWKYRFDFLFQNKNFKTLEYLKTYYSALFKAHSRFGSGAGSSEKISKRVRQPQNSIN